MLVLGRRRTWPKPKEGLQRKIIFRFRDYWGNWKFLETTGDLLDSEHLLFLSRDITEKKALESEPPAR